MLICFYFSAQTKSVSKSDEYPKVFLLNIVTIVTYLFIVWMWISVAIVTCWFPVWILVSVAIVTCWFPVWIVV